MCVFVFVIQYFCVFVINLFCNHCSPALLSISSEYLELGRLPVVVEHFPLSLLPLHFCIMAENICLNYIFDENVKKLISFSLGSLTVLYL